MTKLTGIDNGEFNVLTNEELDEAIRETTEANRKMVAVVGIAALVSGALIGTVTTMLTTVLVKKNIYNDK